MKEIFVRPWNIKNNYTNKSGVKSWARVILHVGRHHFDLGWVFPSQIFKPHYVVNYFNKCSLRAKIDIKIYKSREPSEDIVGSCGGILWPYRSWPYRYQKFLMIVNLNYNFWTVIPVFRMASDFYDTLVTARHPLLK